MEVTQINLNHCDTAQQLLWQAASETKCDVAIIAEPYQVPPDNGNWVTDKAKIAAITTLGKYPIQETVSSAHEGFVIAKINGVFVCSCYAPPRWTIEQFDLMLDKLTEELIGRKPLVIGGDFNAWAVEWGSRLTNARGFNLIDALAKLEVKLANEGTTSTFRRNGRESIIDVTFCSPTLAVNMNWRVCDDYTHSDHQAIRYTLGNKMPSSNRGPSPNERRWKIKTFDKDLFIEALRTRTPPEMNASELTDVVTRACDTAMLRKIQPKNVRRSVYWWSEEINFLRASCLRARRGMQRARTAIVREERLELLRAAKSSLKRAIRLSKRRCFRELCRDVDANPWGSAYRVVMAKIRGPWTPHEQCPERLKYIIEGLFPRHEPTIWPSAPYGQEREEVDRVTTEELLAASRRLKGNKTPGPDGIPNVALKAAIQENPNMFRETLQKYLDEGHFPDIWKRQKLILLPKPGKATGEPSSYRPICLLDTLGKLLERIILNRLIKCTESEHGLSKLQFGFRKGRSTVDAILHLTEIADKALKQKRRGNRFCAVVTVDVKNAFNCASWEAIAEALHKMMVPNYLCRILKSYFENRILLFNTANGEKSLNVTAGVPQGSILGPTLWNGMYNGVLSLKLPKGVNIIGFADDISLTVTGETREEVEMLTTESIRTIESWMHEAKLQIAHHKTEIMLVSNCRSVQRAEITVGEHTIVSKRELKYLGVIIDDRLKFSSHINYACEKAAKAITAIARIMPNNAANSSSKRRLLASVATSTLRYACPAWAAAINNKQNRTLLSRTYRTMAMRVASAYRTISMEAVCVIAGMIPIHIVLAEDNTCYKESKISGQNIRDIRKRVRSESMRKWQQEWNNTPKGRRTHMLIPDIANWVNRRHGEVNFHLTQFLSGHGCFREYLHRFGHASSPHCPECTNIVETPDHVVFECPRFNEERCEMLASGVDIDERNVVQKISNDENTWNGVARAVTIILSKLQRKWREDQRMAQ